MGPVFFICYYVLLSSTVCLLLHQILLCCAVLELKWVYNSVVRISMVSVLVWIRVAPGGLYVWMLSYQEVWPGWRRYATRGGPVSLHLSLPPSFPPSHSLSLFFSASLPAYRSEFSSQLLLHHHTCLLPSSLPWCNETVNKPPIKSFLL
jgi:hypothetical protein